ncbi:hypothetical protein [Pseudorhodobacter aquimaris]|uniref:hypothetical protein n=1 Tax=Pseudorhodobacter aquimaris TaxID=687412 RepID=UPI001E28FBF4|nr:hypothetical protein [Pseudorhodobacter aquimaris]
MLYAEVTSALDPELVSKVTGSIRNLVDQHNLTMLMVTHQHGLRQRHPGPRLHL